MLLQFFALKRFFTFFLDEKSNKKIKPENQKLENYLEVSLRSPSRSSFVLNSRTAAAALLRRFLCFLFKGGGRSGVQYSVFVFGVQCSVVSIQCSVFSDQCSVFSDQCSVIVSYEK